MKKYDFALIQAPNLTLILTLIGFLINKFMTGDLQIFGKTIFICSIIIWSYQEIATGINWFRRILGAVVLTITFINLFNLLQ